MDNSEKTSANEENLSDLPEMLWFLGADTSSKNENTPSTSTKPPAKPKKVAPKSTSKGNLSASISSRQNSQLGSAKTKKKVNFKIPNNNDKGPQKRPVSVKINNKDPEKILLAPEPKTSCDKVDFWCLPSVVRAARAANQTEKEKNENEPSKIEPEPGGTTSTTANASAPEAVLVQPSINEDVPSGTDKAIVSSPLVSNETEDRNSSEHSNISPPEIDNSTTENSVFTEIPPIEIEHSLPLEDSNSSPREIESQITENSAFIEVSPSGSPNKLEDRTSSETSNFSPYEMESVTVGNPNYTASSSPLIETPPSGNPNEIEERISPGIPNASPDEIEQPIVANSNHIASSPLTETPTPPGHRNEIEERISPGIPNASPDEIERPIVANSNYMVTPSPAIETPTPPGDRNQIEERISPEDSNASPYEIERPIVANSDYTVSPSPAIETSPPAVNPKNIERASEEDSNFPEIPVDISLLRNPNHTIQSAFDEKPVGIHIGLEAYDYPESLTFSPNNDDIPIEISYYKKRETKKVTLKDDKTTDGELSDGSNTDGWKKSKKVANKSKKGNFERKNSKSNKSFSGEGNYKAGSNDFKTGEIRPVNTRKIKKEDPKIGALGDELRKKETKVAIKKKENLITDKKVKEISSTAVTENQAEKEILSHIIAETTQIENLAAITINLNSTLKDVLQNFVASDDHRVRQLAKRWLDYLGNRITKIENEKEHWKQKYIEQAHRLSQLENDSRTLREEKKRHTDQISSLLEFIHNKDLKSVGTMTN